jgi:hypothetical protein
LGLGKAGAVAQRRVRENRSKKNLNWGKGWRGPIGKKCRQAKKKKLSHSIDVF